ncbi:hypothetical protein [Pelotomaculum propionicicum]|uniref:Uncharacterized protein n=1 Tax=Pelotomaculum propionicicum TaxID=258475 RepID=A0A4Y7RYB6_9FIRM|nr:hypothetical protein [Pelotomaculum propionicicum]NLI14285.1 hypothetical protein [Peptococcaceae bacterium]TEB13726.1 hypothetical protein Pmgp_00132 [Pelotomaculum propionicicum]
MAKITFDSVITEIRYPFQTLFLDYKGRLAHSLLEIFPYVKTTDNHNEIINMRNNEGASLKLAPDMSGVMIRDYDGLDKYCDFLNKVLENIYYYLI